MLRSIKDMITADEDGQGMVEYGLIVGLIAIIVIAVFVALGPQIQSMFTDVASGNTMEEGQDDLENAME